MQGFLHCLVLNCNSRQQSKLDIKAPRWLYHACRSTE